MRKEWKLSFRTTFKSIRESLRIEKIWRNFSNRRKMSPERINFQQSKRVSIRKCFISEERVHTRARARRAAPVCFSLTANKRRLNFKCDFINSKTLFAQFKRTSPPTWEQLEWKVFRWRRRGERRRYFLFFVCVCGFKYLKSGGNLHIWAYLKVIWEVFVALQNRRKRKEKLEHFAEFLVEVGYSELYRFPSAFSSGRWYMIGRKNIQSHIDKSTTFTCLY